MEYQQVNNNNSMIQYVGNISGNIPNVPNVVLHR